MNFYRSNNVKLIIDLPNYLRLKIEKKNIFIITKLYNINS